MTIITSDPPLQLLFCQHAFRLIMDRIISDIRERTRRKECNHLNREVESMKKNRLEDEERLAEVTERHLKATAELEKLTKAKKEYVVNTSGDEPSHPLQGPFGGVAEAKQGSEIEGKTTKLPSHPDGRKATEEADNIAQNPKMLDIFGSRMVTRRTTTRTHPRYRIDSTSFYASSLSYPHPFYTMRRYPNYLRP